MFFSISYCFKEFILGRSATATPEEVLKFLFYCFFLHMN